MTNIETMGINYQIMIKLMIGILQ